MRARVASRRYSIDKMTDLPYDIWLLIAEYLPEEHVRRLYSVNRSLFHLALNLRHRQASIGILPDRVVEKTNLPILRNTLLVSRPTALQISFHNSSEHSGPSVVQTNFLSSLKPFLFSITNHAADRNARAKLAQLVKHVMPHLIRVSELSFLYARASIVAGGDPDVSLIVPELIRIIGNNLRALHIQSVFAVHLPSQLDTLESFSIDASQPYHTLEIHTVMLQKVPVLLQTQKSTIRNVSLSIDNQALGISPILQSIQLVSCLHSIKLSVASHTSTTTLFKELHDLLESQQQHLRSLAIIFLSERVTSWTDLRYSLVKNDLPFPYLRNLTITVADLLLGGRYIRQFMAPSLVSLKIIRRSPYDEDARLRNFLQIISNFAHLQELSLDLINFNVEHLALLARMLPRLHSLHVDYCLQVLTPDLINQRELPVELSTWELESFNYTRIDHSKDNDLVDSLVATLLPNVLWVCQKQRKECLRVRL